ncbi:hypothetical protein BH11MYX2_BH11MYX2_32060 [soil metagenome]
MPLGAPNFSPFPFGSLPTWSRAEAALASDVARRLRGRARSPAKLTALLGGSAIVRVEVTRAGAARVDPTAALAEVRVDGLSVLAAAPSMFIREVAQRLLGGPPELAAPRPLTGAESGIVALVVAAALEDAGLRGDVWPVVDIDDARRRFAACGQTVELAIGEGAARTSVVLAIPAAMRLAHPPPHWPSWQFDLPVVVGACILAREDLSRLRVRDVIVVERRIALRVGPGDIALEATAGAVEAKVANGYVPRPMVMADDAQLELTVQLATTRLTLRQLSELAPGAIVSLGRPLSGPFEVRAQGRLIGQGELVDVDGELGVRIVTLQE